MVVFDYISKNPLIEHPNQTITMEFEYGKVFNPFSTNVPLLYFLMFSGGIEVEHWLKMD